VEPFFLSARIRLSINYFEEVPSFSPEKNKGRRRPWRREERKSDAAARVGFKKIPDCAL